MRIEDIPLEDVERYGLEWLLDARTKDADVEIKGGRVIWNGGTWHKGIWEDGTWKNGHWFGDQWSSTWIDGTWERGTWHGGAWYDGTWKKGDWYGGIWKGGLWKDGEWLNGTWQDGTWENGRWLEGIWEDGTWKNGRWYGGIWEKGDWKGGIWDDRRNPHPNAKVSSENSRKSNMRNIEAAFELEILKDRVASLEKLVEAKKKGEVPEAFKKQWKNKDKDGDGKENEPAPDFVKDIKKKKASTRRHRRF